MSFLSLDQIRSLGFLKLGKNVLISSKASIYNPQYISIGDDVRIDDFCILSAGVGGILIGNNIHIAAFTSLIGAAKIQLSDFCNLSSRVSIYSSSDDYSGETMTNPTIPNEYKNVLSEPVIIGKHVIIGCGSVILPGVILESGVAIGALSLVNVNCSSFGIYGGIPVKFIKMRDKNLLNLEVQFQNQLKSI